MDIKNFMEELNLCPLFHELSMSDIEKALNCAKARLHTVKKGYFIFHGGDEAKDIDILVRGSITIASAGSDGQTKTIAHFTEPGTLFGEVYLFLPQQTYEHYAQATSNSTILSIPKAFLYGHCGEACDFHQKMMENMLSILAQKAYHLNKRVRLLHSASIRQKIARLLTWEDESSPLRHLGREELANYLNMTRPALSRELSAMAKEGLVAIKGRNIEVLDAQGLEDLC